MCNIGQLCVPRPNAFLASRSTHIVWMNLNDYFDACIEAMDVRWKVILGERSEPNAVECL